MSQKKCDMIRDLLPLYADSVCSEERRKALTDHLAGCAECREMLNKMNQKVAIAADTDISALKKIKRRIRLIKAAVITAAVLLLCGGLFGGYMWAVTDCSMDYEKYNIAENVHVEEDSEGTLWLCMQGNASAFSSYVFPTLSDTNGGHIGYPDQTFDKEKMAGYGVTLRMFRIAKLVPWKVNAYEQRIKVRNDLQYVFYYDDATNTEHVLWGEKPAA